MTSSVNNQFRWKDLTTHLTGYKIKLKKVRENKSILDKEISAARNELEISRLNPATKYKFDIATLRQDKKSKFKTIQITTLPDPPKVIGTF